MIVHAVWFVRPWTLPQFFSRGGARLSFGVLAKPGSYSTSCGVVCLASPMGKLHPERVWPGG